MPAESQLGKGPSRARHKSKNLEWKLGFAPHFFGTPEAATVALEYFIRQHQWNEAELGHHPEGLGVNIEPGSNHEVELSDGTSFTFINETQESMRFYPKAFKSQLMDRCPGAYDKNIDIYLTPATAVFEDQLFYDYSNFDKGPFAMTTTTFTPDANQTITVAVGSYLISNTENPHFYQIDMVEYTPVVTALTALNGSLFTHEIKVHICERNPSEKDARAAQYQNLISSNEGLPLVPESMRPDFSDIYVALPALGLVSFRLIQLYFATQNRR